MVTISELEQAVRDALAHLNDPSYRPAELLWAVTGCDPQAGLDPLENALRQAIESLKPNPDIPTPGRQRRLYDILTYRYIHGLTQEETAEHVGITSRHLRREQQEATFLLARQIWKTRASPEGPTPARSLAEPKAPSGPGDDWRSQVKEELAALNRGSPGRVTNVAQALCGALELGKTLAGRHGVSLVVDGALPDVVATIHPSALRQVLLAALGQLTQQMTSGQITCSAVCVGEQVRITLIGLPVTASHAPDIHLIGEILAINDGSLAVQTGEGRLSFTIELPTVQEVDVLVVDDNLDLVHFYKRFAAGTRYHIQHLSEGQNALEVIARLAPDIIVLDIMLPDIDGWELLAALHEHLTTRHIPVIICSVVREEELAQALGARLYLVKPVHRTEFLAALDQVLVVAEPAE